MITSKSFWKNVFLFSAFYVSSGFALDISSSSSAVYPQSAIDSSVQPDFSGYFSDVQRKSDFWPDIRLLASKLIIEKKAEFFPDRNVTRAEALKILIRSMNAAKPDWVKSAPTTTYTQPSDVPDAHWASDYVETALKYGLISSAQYFRPDDSISRQEVAKVVYRAMTALYPNTVDAETSDKFLDDYDIDAALSPYVYRLRAKKVINGYDDGLFRPKGNITRAHVAKVISRAIFPVLGHLNFTSSFGGMDGIFTADKHISVGTPSSSTIELIESATRDNISLDFKQYSGYSPSVAHSAAIMADAVYMDKEEDIKSFLLGIGFELVLYKSNDLFDSDFTKGYAFFVAKRVGSNGNIQYVISIRGTIPKSMVDWVTNFSVKPILEGGVEGLVHDGFSGLANYVRDNIINSNIGILNDITQAKDLKSTVTITGHSLGGAGANILHALLVRDSNSASNGLLFGNQLSKFKIQTYTFGAPSAGNSSFASAYSDERIYGIQTEEDPVPCVGFLGGMFIGTRHAYAHEYARDTLTSGLGSTNTGTQSINVYSTSYSYIEPSNPWPSPLMHCNFLTQILKVAEHSMKNYADISRVFLTTPFGKTLQLRVLPSFPQ